MTTRKEQAALTREKIIKVTEGLIRTKGHDAIHIADISKACNISAGNVYYYFKSLKELFEEIDDNKFYESLESLTLKGQGSTFSKIDAYFSDWINLTISYYGSQYMYHWTRHYTLRPTDASSENRMKLIAGHLIIILKKGIEEGELLATTPIEQIAYSLAFAIFGCSAFFGITADEDFIQKWRQHFSDTYIKIALNEYIKS